MLHNSNTTGNAQVAEGSPAEPGGGREPAPPRWFWPCVAGLVLAFLVLTWLTRSATVSAGNDDAAYLLLSRSVRTLHYRDAYLVGSPPEAQYPPGYPAALALWFLIAGEGVTQAVLLNMLLGGFALVALAGVARKLVGPGLALAVVATMAVNPFVIERADSVVSEITYIGLAMGALWAFARGGPTRRAAWLAGAAAIASAFARSIGIALVAAMVLTWWLQGRRLRAVVFAAVATVTLGGWLVHTALSSDKIAARSYVASLNPAHRQPGTGMVQVAVRRARAMAEHTVARALPSELPVPTIEGTPVDNWAWLLLIVGGGFLGFLVLWRREPVISLYLAGYFAILTVFPYKVPRFLIPVQPFVILAMVVGLLALSRRLGPARWLAWIACGLIGLTGLRATLERVRTVAACDRAAPLSSPGCFGEEQRGFLAAARFARDSLPSSARFVTVKEAAFAYYADRQVQHPARFSRLPPDSILPDLSRQGIAYLVIAPLIRSPLNPASERLCQQLDTVRTFPPTEVAILRVDLARPRDPAAPACTLWRNMIEADRRRQRALGQPVEEEESAP